FVHEVPMREDGEISNAGTCKEIVFKHLRLATEKGRDYTKLLTEWIDSDPDGAEQAIAYPERADEYCKKGEWALALADHEKFLELTRKKHCNTRSCFHCLQFSSLRAISRI